MTGDPDFLNPYASSGSNTATQATVKQSYIKFLVRSAIVLVLPPIPLYLWSAERTLSGSTTKPASCVNWNRWTRVVSVPDLGGGANHRSGSPVVATFRDVVSSRAMYCWLDFSVCGLRLRMRLTVVFLTRWIPRLQITMGCNGGRELTFLKWRVVRAAPLNPAVRPKTVDSATSPTTTLSENCYMSKLKKPILGVLCVCAVFYLATWFVYRPDKTNSGFCRPRLPCSIQRGSRHAHHPLFHQTGSRWRSNFD